MKKIHTAVTLIIIFFMVAALYICGIYENAPDRIFTGKVSAPEGEWTIDASDGVTKAEVTFSLSDRGEHEEWVLLLRSHWKNYYVRVGDERSITGTEKEMGQCICLIFHQETV